MLPPLTIIPAGAGSGKTHSIQEKLGEWITKGLVAPERIVAVTFTEAAAAELRERIRGKLLSLGRLEDALKLDQAYISTIHGFGLRLLSEFAFDVGLSPSPRLLDDDEQNTLIRLALSRADKVNAVTKNLTKFGYVFEFFSGKSAEDKFREDLLRMVTLLRSSGWTEERGVDASIAADWISERYGSTVAADPIKLQLKNAVSRLLKAYPESLADEYGTNVTAKKELKRDYRNLKHACVVENLDTEWKLWNELRSLRQSKKGCTLPDKYNELVDAVIESANALPSHPGPLDQAVVHIESLLAAGQDVLMHYAEAKREAGLVDYADMIAMAGDMLRSRPDVLATLVGRIDCLVVDEFQDTNPMQFALLWQLKDSGVPTVTVGDLKQAIMGFQGADARLFQQLIVRNENDAHPLICNWRSQPDLMQFINAIGPVLFDNQYDSLAPKGAESQTDAIELIDYSIKPKKNQHAVRALSVGGRVKQFLEETGNETVDRRTDQHRDLRGSDIAVLCPTHAMLSEYAKTLRDLGLRVRVQETGWYSSRIVQLVCQALAYLSNPSDRHAALYLSVTELGSLDLKTALKQLISAGEVYDPILKQLSNLATTSTDRTLYALVADVISALSLFDVISLWPDAAQARANLIRFQSEAGDFMDANREALASGGFYGSGIQSFLAWLSAKIEQKDMNNQPDPRVVDENAIQLVTWHSAKGREWPVVFVCGLDKVVTAKLPDLALGYDSFENLSALMDNAQIEYSPKFSAKESNDKFLQALQDSAELEARRLIYVAITRAREKLVLEWPSFLDGKDSCTYFSMLGSQVAVSPTENTINVNKKVFSCVVHKGEIELPEELRTIGKHKPLTLSTKGRRAIRPQALPTNNIPDSVSPSVNVAVHNEVINSHTRVEKQVYHDGLNLDIGLTGAVLGTYLHNCFEVLGVDRNLVGSLSNSTGIEITDDDAVAIASCVKSFERSIAVCFEPKTIHRELPMLGMNEKGSVVTGTADMVIETHDGVWIIDHKSDHVVDLDSSLDKYKEQLSAYSQLLGSMGFNVLGHGINWIRQGVVVYQRY